MSPVEVGGFGPIEPIAGLDAPDAVSIRDPFAKPGAMTPEGARPIVKVLGLEKFFGSNHVLRGCTMEVYPSETICLIGKSGSGKSTLLRCTNFLEEPTMGAIEVGGIRVDADPLNPRDRAHREQIRQIRLGAQMVFQEFNLFPHLRVIDNLIEAPVRVKGLSRDEAIAIAERFLDKVGLRDKRDEYPSRLSGGQKQRVAIARALTMEPKVLLFDEVTSALDPTLVGEVLMVMEELAHEGATMIVVTHEMAFAREAADRVYFIDQGRFVEVGPPEQVIDAPQDPRTDRVPRPHPRDRRARPWRGRVGGRPGRRGRGAHGGARRVGRGRRGPRPPARGGHPARPLIARREKARPADRTAGPAYHRGMATLTRADVVHVAYLARLGLTEDELTRLEGQLNHIVDQYEKLAELDTDDIPPTAQTIELENILRDDVATPSLSAEAVLANAPERQGDFFVVPAILGGDQGG